MSASVITSQNSGNGNNYTVQSGDTLSGIAKRQGISLAALEKDNPQIKNPDKIDQGETIHLSPDTVSLSSSMKLRSGDKIPYSQSGTRESHAELEPASGGRIPYSQKVRLRQLGTATNRIHASDGSTVDYDPLLGKHRGKSIAERLASSFLKKNAELASIFNTHPVPAALHVNILFQGSRQYTYGVGAVHFDTPYYIDPNNNIYVSPEHPLLGAIAEQTETYETLQGKGWNDLKVNGEALSQFLSDQLNPNSAIKGEIHTEQKYWAGSGYPNVFENNNYSDRNLASNGGGITALQFMFNHGYSLSQIAQTGGSNLQAVYKKLLSTYGNSARLNPNLYKAMKQAGIIPVIYSHFTKD